MRKDFCLFIRRRSGKSIRFRRRLKSIQGMRGLNGSDRKNNENKKDAGNCQLYNSYLHLSFHSIIYKKLPIASHFYIHVTSAAEKASALSYPLSHTRMDK